MKCRCAIKIIAFQVFVQMNFVKMLVLEGLLAVNLSEFVVKVIDEKYPLITDLHVCVELR